MDKLQKEKGRRMKKKISENTRKESKQSFLGTSSDTSWGFLQSLTLSYFHRLLRTKAFMDVFKPKERYVNATSLSGQQRKQKQTMLRRPNLKLSDFEKKESEKSVVLSDEHLRYESNIGLNCERYYMVNLKKDHDDSLTTKMMDTYRRLMNSVGVIMVDGKTLGTGFRVGKIYVATAWHVVNGILDHRLTGVKNSSNLLQAYIVFSDPPDDCSATKYTFKRAYYSDEGLDFAILKISNADKSLPLKLAIRKEPWEPPFMGGSVSLISYGHPSKHNKIIELQCKVVVSTKQEMHKLRLFVHKHGNDLKCNLKANCEFKVVDECSIGYDADKKIFINCFVEKGASGAPMLACINPLYDIVEVVGMLTHGLPEFYYCLNEDFQKRIPNSQRIEAGYKMSHVYENMKQIKPVLAADVFT
ncbi:uncharacterized protein LOC127848634 isoform X2 [Dreissena polymorpha]|nr:uncharacterized protein LOC127848634 isoform X2 [Dreissena polymorpha]